MWKDDPWISLNKRTQLIKHPIQHLLVGSMFIISSNYKKCNPFSFEQNLHLSWCMKSKYFRGICNNIWSNLIRCSDILQWIYLFCILQPKCSENGCSEHWGSKCNEYSHQAESRCCTQCHLLFVNDASNHSAECVNI